MADGKALKRYVTCTVCSLSEQVSLNIQSGALSSPTQSAKMQNVIP